MVLRVFLFGFVVVFFLTGQMSTQHIWIGRAHEAPLPGSEQLWVVRKELQASDLLLQTGGRS